MPKRFSMANPSRALSGITLVASTLITGCDRFWHLELSARTSPTFTIGCADSALRRVAGRTNPDALEYPERFPSDLVNMKAGENAVLVVHARVTGDSTLLSMHNTWSGDPPDADTVNTLIK